MITFSQLSIADSIISLSCDITAIIIFFKYSLVVYAFVKLLACLLLRTTPSITVYEFRGLKLLLVNGSLLLPFLSVHKIKLSFLLTYLRSYLLTY